MRSQSDLLYLAYGSNLHPLRLQERVPSAGLMDVVRLSGQRLMFHKISPDGSSKCDLVESGRRHMAFGALYRMSPEDLPALDAVEGRGSGYDRTLIELPFRGRWLRAFTYRASGTHVHPTLRPFAWYRDLVLAGAEFLGLPQTYRRRLVGVATQADPDPVRDAEHSALLARIRRYPSRESLSTARSGDSVAIAINEAAGRTRPGKNADSRRRP